MRLPTRRAVGTGRPRSPPRGHRLMDWQANEERGTLSFLTIHRNLSAVGIDRVFDDLRAQSRAAGFATHQPLREQIVPNLRRHAFSGILNGERYELIAHIMRPPDRD